ncbi:MAG: hypothetical protein QOJ92_2405 [Frankiales bacterium]|nr:hypothetical protein [Frankiales bacterium]
MVLAALGATLCVPLGAAHAQPSGCDNKRAHTFSSTLPASHPAALKAGSRLRVAVTVTRGGVVPASDVEVNLVLRGPAWFGYGYGVTDANGAVTALVTVPVKARGAARLVVDVHKQVVSLPCGNIEEFDYVETPWGKAVK